MKKYLALLCASLLCVCCLALAACGGSSSGSAASSSAASSSAASASSGSASASASSASASSAAADAAIPGEWKLAAIESQGITMAGDFSQLLGDQAGAALTMKEDGTATMMFGGETTDMKWESSDGKTFTLIAATEGATNAATGQIEGNVLVLNMESEGQFGAMYFTADGKYDQAKVIDTAAATPITSADQLAGEWKLVGLNMMGATMYGSADSLSSAMGGQVDSTINFKSDGTVSLMGTDCTYKVGADGTTIDMGGVTMQVKMVGNNLVIPLGDLLGMDMTFIFEK